MVFVCKFQRICSSKKIGINCANRICSIILGTCLTCSMDNEVYVFFTENLMKLLICSIQRL